MPSANQRPCAAGQGGRRRGSMASRLSGEQFSLHHCSRYGEPSSFSSKHICKGSNSSPRLLLTDNDVPRRGGGDPGSLHVAALTPRSSYRRWRLTGRGQHEPRPDVVTTLRLTADSQEIGDVATSNVEDSGRPRAADPGRRRNGFRWTASCFSHSKFKRL